MEHKKESREEAEGLVKEGVVRTGKTPSVVSGSTSTQVKRGQAYATGEKEVDNIEDLARELD